ncbi:unannotated protein [freshwater metagenome]|uniref:Unannotated protein n=1 Tax=freshwater metagenome TaxID=449393 RepID=A0A6J7HER8_9ZZZZ|nr:hypothetical protein [Actinomycetota bacterium]
MTDKLPDNGGYVAAAYLVFLALLLIYVAIMAVRAAGTERELSELSRLLAEREGESDPSEAEVPA